MEALDATADALVMPADAWSLRLETYYKAQPRTLEVDYARLVRSTPLMDMRPVPTTQRDQQANIFASGRAHAYGTSLQLQRTGTRVDANVVAEVERARRQYPGRFNEQLVPAPWEQPVRIDADITVALGHGVDTHMRGYGVWGRSWALRRAYYDYIAHTEDGTAFEGFDLKRPGQQQLDPLMRVDVGLRGAWEVRGVGLRAQISLINALDRANPFDWSLDTSGTAPRILPRYLPGRRAFVLVGIQY